MARPKYVRIDKLIDAWDPVLRKAFMTGVYNLRDNAQVDLIIRYLEENNIDLAIRAVGLDEVAFRPWDVAIRNGFEAAGGAAAAAVPPIVEAGGFRTIFQFNVRNPVAEAWLQDRSGLQIKEIVEDQLKLVREHMVEGMRVGANPRTTALDLVGRVSARTGRREGGAIGLTSTQEAWVRNYRRELEDGSLDALQRKLRDRRFDGAVREANAAGQGVDPEAVNTMVTAYRNRALRYRAENIARTEAMASLHEAQQQAMEQAVEAGINPEAVTFTWRTAHDQRVRDTHEPMDGQTVAMGELFVTGAGVQLEYPGDPSGPPEEIINCRCWREPGVDFLAGIE